MPAVRRRDLADDVPFRRSLRASRERRDAVARRRRRESGGDPTAISPDGVYRGKYQFTRASWAAVGGTGDPAAAPESEQDQRAALLMAKQGPRAWPRCSQTA